MLLILGYVGLALAIITVLYLLIRFEFFEVIFEVLGAILSAFFGGGNSGGSSGGFGGGSSGGGGSSDDY